MRKGLEAGAVLLLLAGCASVPSRVGAWRHAWDENEDNGPMASAIFSGDLMVEEYGPPDRVDVLCLVWYYRGPWKRIQVWDEPELLDIDRGSSNLEQTIAYPVPDEKRAALAAFSRDLYVSADGAELSARSSSEERNFLLLNLADAIVKGRLNPAQARAAYRRALAAADAGQATPSMGGLLFL
ncbi:MAG TPA: hypothetical protein VH309_13850 [Elusimicrobiota bacterium]|jgi:hypothetical protein|nr:hypothetical protein [Elusimicrobiota bacterium]